MRTAVERMLGGAVALITAALVLEATVRLDDWAQFGVPLTAPAVSLDELSVQDSLGFHARPNSEFRQFRINNLGFRGPDISSNELRRPLIVTAGASETFGLYEKAGKEWPRQLADSLAHCGPAPTVLNAAFAGMSLPTVYADYDRRLKGLAPEVVIYYPTPMQYLYEKAPEPAEIRTGPVPSLSVWRSRALPRFRDAAKRSVPAPLLDLLRRLDTYRTRSKYAVSAKNRVEDTRADRYEADLRKLVGRYRSGGATPVLVVHGNRFDETTSVESKRFLIAWERFYPAYTGQAIVAYDSVAAERTHRVGRDSSLLVIDARASLRKNPESFADFSHFADTGSAILAGAVARGLAPLVCPGSVK